MNSDKDLDTSQLQAELHEISAAVWVLAKECQGDSWALLSLLRTLEHLHREIREEIFQASLPDNRQQLYKLLKDIEEMGGWPYIERMKLRALLVNWSEAVSSTTESV